MEILSDPTPDMLATTRIDDGAIDSRSCFADSLSML